MIQSCAVYRRVSVRCELGIGRALRLSYAAFPGRSYEHTRKLARRSVRGP